MRVGLAAAKAIAQARRVPMIGISSLDLLAFPLRHGTRPIVAVIDARKDEVFWSIYRPVPGGVQRIAEPAVGSIDEVDRRRHRPPARPAVRRRRRAAPPRPARTDAGGEVAEQFLAHPSAAPLVQLAHARALREEWVNPWEIQPLYLRPPDAQINWTDAVPRRTRSAVVSMLARLLRPRRRERRRRALAGRSNRCAAAHLDEVLPIEQASYPEAVDGRARSPASWRWPSAASARTSSPAGSGALVGYAGLMYVVDDAHVTNIAVAPAEQRRGVATRAARRARLGRRSQPAAARR